MKSKIKMMLSILFVWLLLPNMVSADTIYNVDMKINISKNGVASVNEVWTVKASGGSEWYKAIYNLNGSSLTDFKVSMDGKELTYREWDTELSLSQKSGYYGINYVDDGLELCFGKGDMKRHQFTLTYKLSNYIVNTDDSQVLYWTLLPKATVDNFSVEVSSYYNFPDTLDVYGYGYKGYAYVDDGLIKMSNNGNLVNDYVVLLVKFPLGTFNSLYRVDDYNNFSDVYNKAEEGSFKYEDDNSFKYGWLIAIIVIICNLFFVFAIGTFIYIFLHVGYGYKNNKVIDKKNVQLFRDIPCNKDIYYANALINLNRFDYKESNILGAIILKWVKNDKIVFRRESTGNGKKEKSVIDLTRDVTFDNDLEKELFDVMREASNDGILETHEFEKWCRWNYSKFFKIFEKITNDEINRLKSENHIYKRTNRSECKKNSIMDDMIYQDSVNLYGLKKYLLEFSKIDTKEVMEVKLWDEYLMFAYLFGIASSVASQLKNMYPEFIEQTNFDYDTIIFVNHISSTAMKAAERYSSGGGGYSSGGGGGGSFGGGGSMGGR